jgi:hypothetical protein
MCPTFAAMKKTNGMEYDHRDGLQYQPVYRPQKQSHHEHGKKSQPNTRHILADI